MSDVSEDVGETVKTLRLATSIVGVFLAVSIGALIYLILEVDDLRKKQENTVSAPSNTIVAFSASVDASGFTGSASEESSVLFSDVTYNIGASFNNTVLLAPIQGLYQIIIELRAATSCTINNEACVFLNKNGVHQGNRVCVAPPVGSLSKLWALMLVVEDSVWISLDQTSTCLDLHTDTQLTGYLVMESP